MNKYEINLNWQDEIVDFHSMEWVTKYKKYHLKGKYLRMENGSAIREMYCHNWGPTFSSRYTHQETHKHLWDFRSLNAVFWPFKVLPAYLNTNYTKFKIIKLNYFPLFAEGWCRIPLCMLWVSLPNKETVLGLSMSKYR